MRHNNDAMEQQVINILQECSVDGLLIKLPAGQLDRELYQIVAKQLQLIGGKWKGGKTQGFLFKEDPTDYLEKLCAGESINLKKEFQFFATPDEVADRLVELARIESGHIVLDYTLLAMKWWEPNRDFTYFEKKYGNLYPRFADMLISGSGRTCHAHIRPRTSGSHNYPAQSF